jgi:hypothetical protein
VAEAGIEKNAKKNLKEYDVNSIEEAQNWNQLGVILNVVRLFNNAVSLQTT